MLSAGISNGPDSKLKLGRSYWLACLCHNYRDVLGQHYAATSSSRDHVIAILCYLWFDLATLAAFGNGTHFASDQRLQVMAAPFPARKAALGFDRQSNRFFSN